MPRSLNGPVKLQLDIDDGTEQFFNFRALTVDDERDLGNSFDTVVDTPDDVRDGLHSALMPYLIGWQLVDENGKDVPYVEGELFKIISTAEARELTSKLLASGRLSNDEKKSAEPPHLSAAGSSASTAPQESASKPGKASKSSAPSVTVLDADTAKEESSS